MHGNVKQTNVVSMINVQFGRADLSVELHVQLDKLKHVQLVVIQEPKLAQLLVNGDLV
jgi:hypothetical protein